MLHRYTTTAEFYSLQRLIAASATPFLLFGCTTRAPKVDHPPPGLSQAMTTAELALTSWNSEFSRAIFPLTDGVYVAIRYGVSVFSFIEGANGIIMVDAGYHPTWTQEALIDFRKFSEKPICAIVYTHGHIEHFGESSVVVRDDESPIQIWARSNLN